MRVALSLSLLLSHFVDSNAMFVTALILFLKPPENAVLTLNRVVLATQIPFRIIFLLLTVSPVVRLMAVVDPSNVLFVYMFFLLKISSIR